MPDLSGVTVPGPQAPTGAAARTAKTTVRAQILAARRSLSAEVRQQAAVRVQAELLALVRTARPALVAAYAPIASEPGGADLPAVLAEELGLADRPGRVGAPGAAGGPGRAHGAIEPSGPHEAIEPGGAHGAIEPGGAGRAGRLLLPVLQPDLDLDWAYLADPTALSTDPTGLRRGLREPGGPRLGRSAIADAELVVVPAVAVDKTGVRLGRGGGSYDRALTRANPHALVVALLYDGELVDALPAQVHDARVHGVIRPGTGLTRLATWPR